MTPLFSTAYLPPVQYVASMLRHGAIRVEAKETYPKQTYRNRALIMTAGGVRALVVPVVRTHGNHTRTEDVSIDYHTRWNVVHLRTIEAAYAASPYYFHYRDGLERILSVRHERLLDLNEALLGWVQACLKSHVEVEPTADWLPGGEGGAPASPLDFRNAFSPKNASLSLESDVVYEPYYQVFADRMPFEPGLSVVDLLFNLGPEAQGYLRRLR